MFFSRQWKFDLDLKTEWKIKKIFLLIPPLLSIRQFKKIRWADVWLSRSAGRAKSLKSSILESRWALYLYVCCSKRLKFTALNVGQYEVVWLYRPHRLNADPFFPKQTFCLQWSIRKRSCIKCPLGVFSDVFKQFFLEWCHEWFFLTNWEIYCPACLCNIVNHLGLSCVGAFVAYNRALNISD